MSKQLILAGGGNATKSQLVDEFFVTLLPRKKLLFLPQAIAPSIWSYEHTYNWLKQHTVFSALEIIMWENIEHKHLNDLLAFDAIYLMGGNTFTLLRALKQTHFFELLIPFLNKGGIIYGISAGAILMGNNIAIAEIGPEGDKNEVGLNDLAGLNLLNGYAVYTHYRPEEDTQLIAYGKRHNTSIIAIPEEAGVYVHHENQLTILGNQAVIMFNHRNKTMYQVGKQFYI